MWKWKPPTINGKLYIWKKRFCYKLQLYEYDSWNHQIYGLCNIGNT